MTTKYLAIPLIVYVPEGHPFINRGPEYVEGSLLDHLQLIGLEPLIAEDFQSTTIETNHTTHEYPARISAVCPATKPESARNPGFNPNREFHSPSQAVEYCLSFPQPLFALIDLVTFHIHADEMGFAAETIKAFPDGPLPEIQTPSITEDIMRNATVLLCQDHDLLSSYEYPGYIEVNAHGLRFAFGEESGSIIYNFGPSLDPGSIQQSGLATIPAPASPEELARFIQAQVSLQAPAEKTEPEPDPDPDWADTLQLLRQALESTINNVQSAGLTTQLDPAIIGLSQRILKSTSWVNEL